MARPGRRSPPPEGCSGRRVACSRGWRALRRAAGAGARGSGARVSGRQRPPCAKGRRSGLRTRHGPTARGADSTGRRQHGAPTGRAPMGPVKANGAGIAADPTLTGAWTALACLASGEPSAAACAEPCLAPDVSPPATSRRSAPGRGICHRRSRRHPAFAPFLPPCPCPWGSGARGPARGLGRGRVPLPAFPETARLAPLFPVPVQPGSWPVRRHRVAPILGVSPLAFGQGLLQEGSRSARGQMPPPSLG
jgi:hypothetical protein